jgi:hypothetical protein
MTTLDDLLALLPDNDSGEIDAADLRTIVSALWDNDTSLASADQIAAQDASDAKAQAQAAYLDLDARISALEAGGGDGGTPTVQASGRWQTNPQPGTPGGGQVSTDQAAWEAASVLRFARDDLNNNDLANVLLKCVGIYGQQQSDNASWVRYAATGGASDHGSYVEVPVTFVSGAGSIAAAQWQQSVWVFTVPYAEAS